MAKGDIVEMPVIKDGKWTGEWEQTRLHPTLSAHDQREPRRYWVVSDAQLARDLKGRTIDDVYRENRAKRGPERRYEPRHMAEKHDWRSEKTNHVNAGGLGIGATTVKAEYLSWCKSRKHKPHPASINPDHPLNAHRLRAPKAETV